MSGIIFYVDYVMEYGSASLNRGWHHWLPKTSIICLIVDLSNLASTNDLFAYDEKVSHELKMKVLHKFHISFKGMLAFLVFDRNYSALDLGRFAWSWWFFQSAWCIVTVGGSCTDLSKTVLADFILTALPRYMEKLKRFVMIVHDHDNHAKILPNAVMVHLTGSFNEAVPSKFYFVVHYNKLLNKLAFHQIKNSYK